MNTYYFEKIKRLQALAEIGREYSEISFDRERYEEIREISLEMLEKMTDVPIHKMHAILLLYQKRTQMNDLNFRVQFLLPYSYIFRH